MLFYLPNDILKPNNPFLYTSSNPADKSKICTKVILICKK